MSPDENGSCSTFRDGMFGTYPFFFKYFEDLWIVDQGAEGSDGGILLMCRIEDDLDRPANTHAKSSSFGNEYFHENR